MHVSIEGNGAGLTNVIRSGSGEHRFDHGEKGKGKEEKK